MAKKLIPFSWYPYSWGLAGRSLEVARAEYELTGYELKARLLEINKEDMSEVDYNQKLWDLQKKFGKIDEKTYKRNLIALIKDDVKKAIASLELDYEEGKIPQLEYEKKRATLRNEPWVNVVNMDFSKGSSLEGSFELDWNEPFVEKLKSEGYSAPSSDLIVNQWFMEICRNVAMEEFDGTGDFTADSEANLEAMKRWTGPKESFSNGRKGYK